MRALWTSLCAGLLLSIALPAAARAQTAAEELEQSKPVTNAARIYLIFFDFKIGNLTLEAQKVAKGAAYDATHGTTAEIEIVGHADTAEPHPANLSHERALQVKRVLRSMSVPANVHFIVRAAGTSGLLVSTPANTREPQNRFVVIKLRDLPQQTGPNRLQLALLSEGPAKTAGPLLYGFFNSVNTEGYGIERDITSPGDITGIEPAADAAGNPVLEIHLTSAALSRIDWNDTLDRTVALVLDGHAAIAIARKWRAPAGPAIFLGGNLSADDIHHLMDTLSSS